MTLVDKYLTYVRDVRRYSARTVSVYGDVLKNFMGIVHAGARPSDEELTASLNHSEIRRYEVEMLEKGLSARTVRLHLSALSGFCRFLVNKGILKSNPVKLVTKPKMEKRLPVFFRKEAMEEYFRRCGDETLSAEYAAMADSFHTVSGRKAYDSLLGRLIISLLYNLGLRRSELIGLTVGNLDFGRKVVKVSGKGDKMREIPLISSLCKELLLYLDAVEKVQGGKRSLKEPLLVTYAGRSLYPAYVDRAVKRELGDIKEITGRKSPHVLRHSLATELMNEGADIYSIKEMLGHSSLAATQVYTHSDISQLKSIYKSAHPRAKNGGKHGD
jgi:integrase/recombinase XerC